MASDPMEFTGILAQSHQSRPERLPVDWARSARLGEYDVLLAANGVGWNRAAAAVDAGASFRPDAVVSTGFCGALDPALDIADVVVGTGIRKHAKEAEDTEHKDHTGKNARVTHTQTFAGESACATGVVCSIDHVVQTSEEKGRLHASGASVVEMEAAGVAERAKALGLPFHCVKAVTDLASETMANDFNAALRSDGHFATMLILRRSLRHPTVRLPELLRLRNRCVRAARALGEFFADCRF